MGDGDLDELVALAALTFGLGLEYLDGSFRLPRVGRFQYAICLIPELVFCFHVLTVPVLFVLSSVSGSALGLLPAGGNNIVITRIP